MRSLVQQQYDALKGIGEATRISLKWLLERKPEEYSLRISVENQGEDAFHPEFRIWVGAFHTDENGIGHREFKFNEVPIIDAYMRKHRYHRLALNVYLQDVNEDIEWLKRLKLEAAQTLKEND